MEWEVEFTEEFETWWNCLTLAEQEAVNAKVMLLQKIGPLLSRPQADVIHASRHPNMKELRIQHSADLTEYCSPLTRVAARCC